MRQIPLCMSAVLRAAGLYLVLILLSVNGARADQPGITPWPAPFACPNLAPATPEPGTLRVTFLGVSTLLFDDGETQFLTDGLLSRPDIWSVAFGKIKPDPERIASALRRAGIERLAAVIPFHSHYDHVMDAPEVAKRTGALLIGSESTANVGRGWGLPEDRIRVFHAGQKFTFGRFDLEIVLSKHSPGSAGGNISQPLRSPAAASQYLEGGTYSILVRHSGRTLLVGGRGETENVKAEVVFLGLASYAPAGEDYWQQTWQRNVVGTGARRVIPVHWDNFFLPLNLGLQALWLPDVGKVLNIFKRLGQTDGVDVKCAPLWEKVDPFAGLKP